MIRQQRIRSAELVIGASIILVFFVVCLISPMVSPELSGELGSSTGRFVSPSLSHPLGLDPCGRDLLRRMIRATDSFFLPGILACFLAMVGGVLVGTLGGAGGPWTRRAVAFVLTTVNSIPRLVLILLVCTVFGGSMEKVALAMGLSFIPPVAEEIAQKVEQYRREDYYEADRAHGLSLPRILLHHVIWLNCFPLMVRWVSYLFGYIVLVETSLSYLGTIEGFVDMGVQEPAPSWGNMLALAKDSLFEGDWWPVLAPSAAISLSIFAFIVFGEGVEDRFQRGEREVMGG